MIQISMKKPLARVLYEYEMNGVPHPKWEVLDKVMKTVWEKRATRFEHILWDHNLQISYQHVEE